MRAWSWARVACFLLLCESHTRIIQGIKRETLGTDMHQISKQDPFSLASMQSVMSFGWEIKVSKFWFCCLLEKLQDSSFLLSLSPPLLPKKNGCFFLNLKTILFKSNCKNLYYSDSYKENVQITRNPTVNILREIVIRMHTNTHFTHSHTMLHRLL